MSWPTCTLEHLVKVSKGKKHNLSNTKTSVRYLQIDDLRNDDLIKYTDDRQGTFVNPEDLIIAWDGANAGTIGYGLKGLIGSTLARLHIVKDGVDTQYLGRFLQSRFTEIRSNCTGATIPHVSKSHLLAIDVPLPPLAEQKRIAAILDKADAIRRKRQQAIQLADDCLRAVFLEMFGDPLSNPKAWISQSLGELTNKITDGKHGDCEDDNGSGYYFISAKDVNNGIINYERARQIVKKDFDEVHRRTDLQPGDLVMINTGATIGRVAIVLENDKTPRTTFQKSVAIIKPKKEILNSTFLKHVFLLRIEDFASVGSGSAIKNLLLSQMREFPIILPPMDLQLKFEKIVHQTEISKINSEQSNETSTTFFSALSQKAFSGQLQRK